ncbi:hypothetical protein BHE74_00025344 [Ensete ventricosum]|nr:hypothetical protein BHE74_00025344 [Ensete ventricosum]
MDLESGLDHIQWANEKSHGRDGSSSKAAIESTEIVAREERRKRTRVSIGSQGKWTTPLTEGTSTCSSHICHGRTAFSLRVVDIVAEMTGSSSDESKSDLDCRTPSRWLMRVHSAYFNGQDASPAPSEVSAAATRTGDSKISTIAVAEIACAEPDGLISPSRFPSVDEMANADRTHQSELWCSDTGNSSPSATAAAAAEFERRYRSVSQAGRAVPAAWCFGDPDTERRRRVASYKAYSVEGKVKASLRKCFGWVKAKCSGIVRGW